MVMAETLVIFDTNCVLCSSFVQFVLRHERRPDIIFVNAWSAAGADYAARHGLSVKDLNETFLVISGDKGFVKSQATFKIIEHLRWPWKLLHVLRIVPRSVRDAVYSLISRNRYKWFGYKEACFVVASHQNHRFIDTPYGAQAQPGAS